MIEHLELYRLLTTDNTTIKGHGNERKGDTRRFTVGPPNACPTDLIIVYTKGIKKQHQSRPPRNDCGRGTDDNILAQREW